MKFLGRVDGLEDLQAELARIGDAAALAGALSAAAEDIRTAAASLQDGKPLASPQADLPGSLKIVPAADGMSVTVGTALPQGWHQEFGSLTQPATPWLEPALEAARPSILARLRLWLAARE